MSFNSLELLCLEHVSSEEIHLDTADAQPLPAHKVLVETQVAAVLSSLTVPQPPTTITELVLPQQPVTISPSTQSPQPVNDISQLQQQFQIFGLGITQSGSVVPAVDDDDDDDDKAVNILAHYQANPGELDAVEYEMQQFQFQSQQQSLVTAAVNSRVLKISQNVQNTKIARKCSKKALSMVIKPTASIRSRLEILNRKVGKSKCGLRQFIKYCNKSAKPDVKKLFLNTLAHKDANITILKALPPQPTLFPEGAAKITVDLRANALDVVTQAIKETTSTIIITDENKKFVQFIVDFTAFIAVVKPFCGSDPLYNFIAGVLISGNLVHPGTLPHQELTFYRFE